MEPPTLLIVDDNPESLEALVEFLKAAGFRIILAQNGSAALQLVEQAQPDLILLDVLMPGLDGFETCRRLKQLAAVKEIPVLFMTAVAELVEKVKGFEAGGVDYLTKPVQHEEVLARLNTHLTIRKLQQRLQEQNALLEEQNERFRILAEATFEGILIHYEGCIVEINQTLEQMFGYPYEDVLGRNVLEFLAPQCHPAVIAHIRARDNTPYEAEGIRKNGAIFPVKIQARTIPYQGREVRVVAIRDLTLAAEKAQLERENRALRSSLQDRYKFGEIIGKSPAMQEVYETIIKAAATDASVVIYGESGTGKELAARTIHQLSERKAHAFVPVNCGAVPETLFESEFFGYRKGAFTGATMDKPGFFDRAHKGILFLDEVTELNPAMQVKLLRVLQDGEYTPLGAVMAKTADVRIIAATNQDLREQLQKGVIREDFFYRIRVIVITLPPLRERKEDIPLLIEYFLNRYAGGKDRPVIPGRLSEMFGLYDWPGNVRELQNELQRYLAEQRLEFLGQLKTESEQNAVEPDVAFTQTELSFHEALDAYEKRLLISVLARYQGHAGKTAESLRLPLRTLYRKMKKYHLL